MSDQRIREAERKWKETGTVEDEAVYLVERVRAGKLDQSMVALAAHLRYPAALIAKGIPLPGPTVDDEEAMERWLLDFERWDDEVDQRVIVALKAVQCLNTGQPINPAYHHMYEQWLLTHSDDGYLRLIRVLNEHLDIDEPGVIIPWLRMNTQFVVRWLAMVDDMTLTDTSVSPHATAFVWMIRDCQQEVVPWALGYRDLVRERVDERHRERLRSVWLQ